MSQVVVAQVPWIYTAVMPTASTDARATAVAFFMYFLSVC